MSQTDKFRDFSLKSVNTSWDKTDVFFISCKRLQKQAIHMLLGQCVAALKKQKKEMS